MSYPHVGGGAAGGGGAAPFGIYGNLDFNSGAVILNPPMFDKTWTEDDSVFSSMGASFACPISGGPIWQVNLTPGNPSPPDGTSFDQTNYDSSQAAAFFEIRMRTDPVHGTTDQIGIAMDWTDRNFFTASLVIFSGSIIPSAAFTTYSVPMTAAQIDGFDFTVNAGGGGTMQMKSTYIDLCTLTGAPQVDIAWQRIRVVPF